ncbi:hypothetical protein PVAP13_7NG406750 [Panicum virgatum]|uniref:Uncharacterized protein n=1 Tax=Panicum virgatum TaxID=38727 RepID=A0A8T0Q440_PANVG|nr:hypothetical protein PVAP13_7NG406750 [Panicum virgatum]
MRQKNDTAGVGGHWAAAGRSGIHLRSAASGSRKLPRGRERGRLAHEAAVCQVPWWRGRPQLPLHVSAPRAKPRAAQLLPPRQRPVVPAPHRTGAAPLRRRPARRDATALTPRLGHVGRARTPSPELNHKNQEAARTKSNTYRKVEARKPRTCPPG